MINTKFYKEFLNDDAYFQAAIWCNENGAMIVDQGDYYEVVEIPAPPLEEVKAAKIAELKASRDAAEIEPIEHNGNRFDYDEQARDRLAIARQAIEDGAADIIVWTTADNTRVSLALDDFKGIGIAAALRSNALHVRYNELKLQVQAAETAEDVAVVVW